MVTKSTATAKPDTRSYDELVDSVELAHALMHSIGTGVYIVQEGKFVYVSSLFQEITGYTEKELIGTYSLNYVYPEDKGIVRRKAIESLKGRSSPPYEYRFISKNGDIVWVLERVTSTEYRGRLAAVGSFMDVTEHKQAEESLRESEERHRIILESIEDGYYEVDIAGNLTSFNDSLCNLMGYSREELMGMNYRDYTSMDSIELLRETGNQVYQTGKPIKAFSWEVIRKDGGIRFIEISFSPM